MTVRTILAGALLYGSAVACASMAAPGPPGRGSPEARPPLERAPSAADAALAAEREVLRRLEQRLLVRRAEMRVEAEDPAALAPRVRGVADGLGGYLAALDVETDRGNLYENSRRSLRATLRVPEAALDAALDSLARLGTVRHRSVSAQDVTEQVVDVDARVASLTAVRDRLREQLQRAANVTETLAVERELARVQQELDAVQARLKSLRSRAALSELTFVAEQPHVLGPLGKLFVGLGRALGKLFVIR